MDQRQQAEQGQCQIGNQGAAGLNICVFLDLDRRDHHTDQVNIEHDPLFQTLQHQQHWPQVHAERMAKPQVQQ